VGRDKVDRLDELEEESVSHSPKVEAFRCIDIVGGPWLPRRRGRRAHYCEQSVVGRQLQNNSEVHAKQLQLRRDAQRHSPPNRVKR
jgi:hypothetical protein